MDNKNELWIWQGWWPNIGTEDQSGSKAVRWQAERRAAMTMAMQYWQKIHPEINKYPIYLVWAGLEPLQFINLFPTWIYRDDIAELNIEVFLDFSKLLKLLKLYNLKNNLLLGWSKSWRSVDCGE